MLEKYKGKKVVMGVSGGPDSMALLNMAVTQGVQVSIAHVNYHHRPTADRDETIVVNYANTHGLDYRILNPVYSQGNFQNWARIVRYDFFVEVALEVGSDTIMIAHQEDDVLETYLFQKKRNSVPSTWGINPLSQWKGMKVVRPLLHFSKQELENYCQQNEIAYGIDESNLSEDYERNRLRHAIVEKLSTQERMQLLDEIRAQNELRECFERSCENALIGEMTIDKLMNFSNPEALIQKWIKKETNRQISKRQAHELWGQLQSKESLIVPLFNCVKLSKNGIILEISEENDVSYSYQLDKLELLNTPYFRIEEIGKSTEAVTLSQADFPITIRNAQKGDSILLRFGRKKLSRWFIDRKIPRLLRKSWPVVVNCTGEVILVPQIGCDVKHYSNNPSCFVIK